MQKLRCFPLFPLKGFLVLLFGAVIPIAGFAVNASMREVLVVLAVFILVMVLYVINDCVKAIRAVRELSFEIEMPNSFFFWGLVEH